MRRVPLAVLTLLFLVIGVGGYAASADCPGGLCSTDEAAIQAPAFAPRQLLVRFWPEVSGQQALEIVAEEGAERVAEIPALGVRVLHLPPQLAVEDAIERFQRRPEVAYAEPNYVLRTAEVDDPGLENQWAPQAIDAPAAWALATGDPAVTIAVVDTGIDYRHTELAPNMWFNPGEVPGNGLDDDGNGRVDDVHGWDFVNSDGDPLDDMGHGTHVAGIAAAADNSNPAGLVGICPACSLMAVKALDASGAGPLDTIAAGIVYATDEGAKVINLSLGAEIPFGSAVLEDAVNYAWNAGVVVVAAAGNDGHETNTFYPAAYANAVGVASSNEGDLHSCYSNWGASLVSVSAPGEAIYSTMPLDGEGNDVYEIHSGTSMASPHVAGLAGLLFSDNPEWSNVDVRGMLQDTTEDLGPEGSDPYFGSGRINALRALTGDTSYTFPFQGSPLAASFNTASGYANARKLARDASGTLHLAWHTQDGGEYRIVHSSSADNGAHWSAPEVVFSSAAKTYHPALAVDGDLVYIAFPTMDGGAFYRILFTRRPLAGGDWSSPEELMGGNYDTVRPDLYVDPTNGKLHCVASSLDDARQIYYLNSSDQGTTWGPLRSVDPNPAYGGYSRYASVHACGDNVYVAVRTIDASFFVYYYLHTLRSTDGGQTWIDQTKISSYLALTTSEYGVSLAGVGDRLYMVYEVGGNLYFRRWDGSGWSDYLQLESSGRWPTVSQAEDGQAWMIWEDEGSLLLRHYTGSEWEASETILESTPFSKAYLPNLKLGTSGGRLSWVYTRCSGSPFCLAVDSRTVGQVDEPPVVQILTPAEASTVSGEVAVEISAIDAEDPDGTLEVQWGVDGGGWQTAIYNSSSGSYEASWDTAGISEGAHTIDARATDSATNTTLDSKGVIVDNTNVPPVASFLATCNGLTCDFDASASTDPDGTIASYEWGFGDGTTGSGMTTSHSYGASGSYQVELTVTDNENATDTSTGTVSVEAPPTTLHVGDLDGDRTRERSKWTAIVTIFVHDADHNPVENAAVSGTWSNGATGPAACMTDSGGNCAVSRSGIRTGVSSVEFTVDDVSHGTLNYTPADNHDPDGDSTGTVITVYLQPPTNQPPVASFVYDCTGRACDFDAAGSADPDGTIVTYAWDFADGTTGEGLTASHTYGADGSYSVVLTVTDDAGASDPETQTVQIGPAGPPIHVGDLDGSGLIVNKKFWKASVTITIHGESHGPLANATVWATWSGGASGTDFCLTDALGECTIVSGNIKLGLTAILTIDDVTAAGYTYEPASNHDPDGDSDGTSIVIELAR